MKRLFWCASVIVLAGTLAVLKAADPRSGPGAVFVGVDASVWDSSVPAGPGIVPIGGSGQINGEFTIAERLGIQIGLRAQERFVGPLPAMWSSRGGHAGIYQAATGVSDAQNRATWNYDWHVDLRQARGVARGTTLDDYDLTLDTDMFASQFGLPVPIDLTFGGLLPPGVVLYQNSHNAVFGNTGFDPLVPGTYTLRLVLTPRTFHNPPLAVEIVVVVS